MRSVTILALKLNILRGTCLNTLEKSPLHVCNVATLPVTPNVWNITCFHTPVRNLLPVNNATTNAKCLISWRCTWESTMQQQMHKRWTTFNTAIVFAMNYLFLLTDALFHHIVGIVLYGCFCLYDVTFFQLWWLIMTTFCIPTLFSIGCPGESCLRDSEKSKFWTRDPRLSSSINWEKMQNELTGPKLSFTRSRRHDEPGEPIESTHTLEIVLQNSPQS